MIETQGYDISSVRFRSYDLLELRVGSGIVWQAGNFITADRESLRTADGEVFNCREE